MFICLMALVRVSWYSLGGVGTPPDTQTIQKWKSAAPTKAEPEPQVESPPPQVKPQTQLAPSDQAQVQGQPRLDQQPLLAIEHNAQSSGQLPSQHEITTLKTVAHMLDKHLDDQIKARRQPEAQESEPIGQVSQHRTNVGGRDFPSGLTVGDRRYDKPVLVSQGTDRETGQPFSVLRYRGAGMGNQREAITIKVPHDDNVDFTQLAVSRAPSVDKRSQVSSAALDALQQKDREVSKKLMETGLEAQSAPLQGPERAPRQKAPTLAQLVDNTTTQQVSQLGKFHTQLVADVNGNQQLTGIVKVRLSEIVTPSLLPMALKSGQVPADVQAETMVNQISRRHPSFFHTLQNMSPADRKSAVAAAVGKIKHKDAAIKSICAGIDRALQNPQPAKYTEQFQPAKVAPVDRSGLDALVKQGRDMGVNMIRGSQDMDGLRQLASKSDEQLKYEVGKSLGYTDKQIGSLNRDQQQLVDSVLSGVRAALEEKHCAPQQKEMDALVKRITVNPSQPVTKATQAFVRRSSEDTQLGLSLKSTTELQQMVLLSLGEEHKQISDLPPDKQKLVNAIVDGIRTGLPNQAGKMTTIKAKGVDIEVPETLQIGTRTYGQPEYLAQGGLGRVMKYTDLQSGESVVVKDLIRPAEDETGELTIKQRQAMVHEIQIHHRAMGPDGEGNPNLVALKGAVQGAGDRLYMVMDHVDGTDLHDLKVTLQDMQKDNILSPSDDVLVRQFLSRGIIDGLIQMHDLDIVHGDFKSPNSMYDRHNGQAKVIDLGTARHDPQGVVTDAIREEVANPVWKAPELSRKGSSFDERVDAFSLGQTIHELMTGQQLNDSAHMSDIEDKHEQLAQTGEQALKGTQTSFSEVINSSFAGRPDDRARLKDLRQNEFFNDTLGSDERAQALLDKVCDLAAVNGKIAKQEELKVPPDNPGLLKLKAQASDLAEELRALSARRNLGHEGT